MIPDWLLNITKPAVLWVDALPEWLGAALCFLFVSLLFVLAIQFLRWTESFAAHGGFWMDRTRSLNEPISPRRLTECDTPGAVETKNLTASARLSVKRTQGEVVA